MLAPFEQGQCQDIVAMVINDRKLINYLENNYIAISALKVGSVDLFLILKAQTNNVRPCRTQKE